MAHQGDSNKSQFFICFAPVRLLPPSCSSSGLMSSAPQASWCDGKHVVLGQVLREDLPHLTPCEAQGSRSGRPILPIEIKDAGQLSGDGFKPVA